MRIERLAEIRHWMFDLALPLWADRGVDQRHGGFIEALDFTGADAGAAFKRTRVACRQVYVFSHAALMGHAQYLPLADSGIDYLADRAWMAPKSAFARRLSPEGAVIDPTIDLYDHAFALFAFAWRHRVDGNPRALAWAHRTLDAIEHHLAQPNDPGFLHALPATGWRQQNPHMHLLEACLAAWDATGDDRFAAMASRLANLFRSHFFDAASGRLIEFFDETWRPAPGADGRITEPGHQFEWAWILASASRLPGLDFRPEARRLVETAERDGVDPVSHATYNQIAVDGSPLDRGSRTWPNTERLKAAVAMWEIDGRDPSPVINQSAGLLLDRYLTAPTPGGWIDAFDANGRATAADMPTSTLYHIFLAFAEVLRIGEADRKS